MPHLQSTIEAVAIKPLAQPDNFGNTFRVGMKFGEDWYSYGTIKKDQLDVKVGNDWVTVTKGMEVEFMYKENTADNGTVYKNVEKKSFTITNQEGGVAPRAAQQQAPQQQGQQQQAPASKGSFVNPATVGACLNLAIEVLGYTKKDFEDEGKLRAAIKWHKTTFDKMLTLYPTVEVGEEEVVKSKPKAKPAPAPVVEDSYDDDDI
jgi:hypothetical protein